MDSREVVSRGQIEMLGKFGSREENDFIVDAILVIKWRGCEDSWDFDEH